MPEPCPQCGSALPANAPHGICPRCLLRAGMDDEPHSADRRAGETIAGGSSFVPRSASSMAALFPQFEILELLGAGGMGAVYKARQPALDRLVAIKVLPPEVGGSPEFAERFAREARALARLSHQNIVSIFDFGCAMPPAEGEAAGEPASYYFVMEYVDGMNLRQLMQQGSLAPSQALGIVSRICEALQFAHEEGVVHRDIKPENILVDQRGRVKIADFGLAKLLRAEPVDVTLTRDRQVMGTWHYMAPEQIERPLEVDHRADIYSLGVVFYEMLTGQVPVGRFDPPSRRSRIDARLDDVVLRALERQRELRYQHASELQSDVESISSSSPSPLVREAADPGAKEPPRAAPWKRFAAVLLLLVYAASMLGFFWCDGEYRHERDYRFSAGQPSDWFIHKRWEDPPFAPSRHEALMTSGVSIQAQSGVIWSSWAWFLPLLAAVTFHFYWKLRCTQLPAPGAAGSPHFQLALWVLLAAIMVLLGWNYPTQPARVAGLAHFCVFGGVGLAVLAAAGSRQAVALDRQQRLALIGECVAIGAILGLLALVGFGMWVTQSAWLLIALCLPGAGSVLAATLDEREETTLLVPVGLAIALLLVAVLLGYGIWLEQSAWPLLAIVMPLFGLLVGYGVLEAGKEDAEKEAESEDEPEQAEEEEDEWGCGTILAMVIAWNIVVLPALSFVSDAITDLNEVLIETLRLDARLERPLRGLLWVLLVGGLAYAGYQIWTIIIDAHSGGEEADEFSREAARERLHARLKRAGLPVIILLMLVIAAASSSHREPLDRQAATPAILNVVSRKLLAAAAQGETARIRELLQEGAAVNVADPASGQTALMKAASSGRSAAVDLLMQHRADPLARDRDGRTALMLALLNKQTGLVEQMLEQAEEALEAQGTQRVYRGFVDPEVLAVRDNQGRTARQIAQQQEAYDLARQIERYLQQIVDLESGAIEKGDSSPWYSHYIRGLARRGLGLDEQAEADLARSRELAGQ